MTRKRAIICYNYQLYATKNKKNILKKARFNLPTIYFVQNKCTLLKMLPLQKKKKNSKG